MSNYLKVMLSIFTLCLLAGSVSFVSAQTEQDSFDQVISFEAKDLMSKTDYTIYYPEPDWLINDLYKNVLDDLVARDREVSADLIQTATIFIYEGTQSSKMIGFGERMSVIKSFYNTFDRFPETELDWQDVIKISAGRWPSQRNLEKEASMEKVFEKIYLRLPDMNNPHDNAMITVATYGLRPQKIDYNKQSIAWRYFSNTITSSEKLLSKTEDHWEYQKMWDIIRGIAYSGATRY